EPIRNVSELQTFLNQAGSGASANDPCVLPPVIWTDTGGWNALFETINAAGKYVALDMSKTPVGEGCVLPAAFSYGCGSTDNARAGKGRVVSFVLPDGINSIGDFLNFNVIKNVTGVGVEAIGDSAFYGCVDLETINFPSVVTIDNHSFRDCASLKNANFPLAETIGHHAFRNCASLKNVDFPSAVMIGSETFRDCAILEAVNFPLAEIIDALAFYGCTSLETVNLPNVGIIKEKAFQVSGNATLAVALGQTAPSLERDIFYSVNVSKTITVNIPAVNSGYGTTGTYSGANSTACWANGFRGGGWGGSGFVDASKINQNITVILQEASSGAE
ncbi:MAG: leucine-rich repeat domain-containing protein, partial [Spirochaetaceae bacterium]|nr:leucine-rich repeat domain-containing protein [Spirochaetaceae bacterium]